MLLRTQWLARLLEGREVLSCRVQKESLAALPERVTGRRVRRVFCKGKHIFFEFEGGTFLHNHLLMRGTWTR